MYAHRHSDTFTLPETPTLSLGGQALEPWDVGQMRRLAERERSLEAVSLFSHFGRWLADLAHSRARHGL